MLTKQGCLERRTRLWDILDESIEWALVADPRHVNYLTGFWVNPISFSTCERALLLLHRNGRAQLFCDNFTLRSASCDPHVQDVFAGNWYDHLHSIENRDHVLFATLQKNAGVLDPARGCVEAEWAPVAAMEWLGIDPAPQSGLGAILRTLRRNKHDDEIKILQRCIEAGDAGHAEAFEAIYPGATELDVFRAVQSAAIDAAGEAAIVYGDFRVVDGETPRRGGLPTDHKLQEGELFIVDYSVVLHGYRGDFTNTIAVGQPTDQQVELHASCVKALAAGEKSLRAGQRAADISHAVSQSFIQDDLPALIHHAGHGIGLGHPESPILVPESTDVLQVGDVVTLEPGAYLGGIGGARVEHNFLIEESSARRMSNHELRIR